MKAVGGGGAQTEKNFISRVIKRFFIIYKIINTDTNYKNKQNFPTPLYGNNKQRKKFRK